MTDKPDARKEADVSEVSPLVEFFRGPGFDRFGNKGDYEMWSAEQTAVHFLTEYLNATTPTEWPIRSSHSEVARLRAAVVALADAGDRIGEHYHIVQPLLDVYRRHGETIAEARTALQPEKDVG